MWVGFCFNIFRTTNSTSIGRSTNNNENGKDSHDHDLLFVKILRECFGSDNISMYDNLKVMTNENDFQNSNP